MDYRLMNKQELEERAFKCLIDGHDSLSKGYLENADLFFKYAELYLDLACIVEEE